MPGMMITSPGPFTRQKRPSMNTTPRSYSRRMRMAENSSRTMTATMKPVGAKPISGTLLFVWFDCQGQSFHPDDPDFLSLGEGHARMGAPALAEHAHRPALGERFERLAGRADHLFLPADHRAPARLERQHDHAEEHRGREQRHRDDQLPGDIVSRHLGVEQDDR